MIIVDGNKSDVCLSNYNNLEEVLVHLTSQTQLSSRVVTDVLLNNEPFSELYPHQAEDIASSEIQSLELKTVTMDEMSADVVTELPKVVNIIAIGTRAVSAHLRKAEVGDALDILLDTIEVSRHLLGTVQALLQSSFAEGVQKELSNFSNQINSLLTEILESMGEEDWVLTADLLEYEFIPAIDGISKVIATFNTNIKNAEYQ